MIKLSTILISILLSTGALAAELSIKDENTITSSIKSLQSAAIEKNVDFILNMTNEQLINIAGGRDAFRQSISKAFDELEKYGLQIENYEIKKPQPSVETSNEVIVFIPVTSTMRVNGKHLKSTSYIIASRKIDSSDWKYMDGSAMRRNPELLYIIHPELPKLTTLPENKLEQIE